MRTRSTWPPPSKADSGAQEHLDAVVSVDVAVDRAHLDAEHVRKQHRARVDHRHLEAGLASRGRSLAPDPARADHHELAAPPDPLPQPVGIRQRAQVVDPVEIRSRERQAPRLRAGRQQQPVIRQPLASREHDLRRRRVDALHGRCGTQLDLVARVEALRLEKDLLQADLAAQIILGQRRALIGTLGL